MALRLEEEEFLASSSLPSFATSNERRRMAARERGRPLPQSEWGVKARFFPSSHFFWHGGAVIYGALFPPASPPSSCRRRRQRFASSPPPSDEGAREKGGRFLSEEGEGEVSVGMAPGE